jgi:hypothetical protein
MIMRFQDGAGVAVQCQYVHQLALYGSRYQVGLISANLNWMDQAVRQSPRDGDGFCKVRLQPQPERPRVRLNSYRFLGAPA